MSFTFTVFSKCSLAHHIFGGIEGGKWDFNPALLLEELNFGQFQPLTNGTTEISIFRALCQYK